MTSAINGLVSGDLSDLVSELLIEFRGYDGPEERLVKREYLTCSVMLELGVTGKKCMGFSRDISDDGVGLITEEKIEPNTVATLSIERFDGTHVKLRAICRWARYYGPNWHLTGWEFQRLLGVRRY